MTTKSSGFTLVELLVVVAIIGILSAIGIVSYSGYTKSAKVSSTKSIMQQIALMQTEYLSNVGGYFTTHTAAADCSPSATSSENIERELFPRVDADGNIIGGEDVITLNNGFNMCVVSSGGGYLLIASTEPEQDGTIRCRLELTQSGILNDEEC